jgi:hypothetical protein
MAGQRRADLGPVPVHDVEHAGRQPRGFAIRAKWNADIGVISDGLATTVFPVRQRGSDLPRQKVEREVPRRDARDHAQGRAERVVERAPSATCSSELPCRIAVAKESESSRRRAGCRSAGQSDGLPVVDALDARQLVDLALDAVGDREQDPRSLGRRVCDQRGNAFFAAATAASMSFASPSGTSA